MSSPSQPTARSKAHWVGIGALLAASLSVTKAFGVDLDPTLSDFEAGEQIGELIGFVLVSAIAVWLAVFFVALRGAARGTLWLAFAAILGSGALGCIVGLSV